MLTINDKCTIWYWLVNLKQNVVFYCQQLVSLQYVKTECHCLTIQKAIKNGVNKQVDSACGSRRKYNRFGLVWVFLCNL